MPSGIIITGPSGSGKTTLGRIVADRLCVPYLDIDDFIWRKDTELPFTKMYSRDEKISRLAMAVAECDEFVMAGSMDSFHDHFDPMFVLTAILNASPELRRERVHRRAVERFGNRVLDGGDMHEDHIKYLDEISGYDEGRGRCTLQFHEKWLASLPCPSIRLDGALPLEENAEILINAYKHIKSGTH